MENFKILSLKEEEKLSIEEKKEYYLQLRKFLENRKLTNTTPYAEYIGPKLKNITNRISKSLTNVLSGKNVEYVSDGQENIPNGPVIFAHTHQGLLDNFSWIPETPIHCIIFHSKVVKKFLILVQLNTGLVLVNKDDKDSRLNAKLDMIKILQNGHSLAFFPESAWNLSPNKLHLPLNYGFLDIARKANVPVVPVVDEYSYDTSTDKEHITKIHIRFGHPIYVSINDNLTEKLNEYSEQISTIRWDLITEKGLNRRCDISNADYVNYLKANIRNLQLGGIDIDIERKHLWMSDDDFYQFHHINDIPFDEYGNLLDTEEVIKLKQLNIKHHI